MFGFLKLKPSVKPEKSEVGGHGFKPGWVRAPKTPIERFICVVYSNYFETPFFAILLHLTSTFESNKELIQWGSEIWTSLDFESQKEVGLHANGL